MSLKLRTRRSTLRLPGGSSGFERCYEYGIKCCPVLDPPEPPVETIECEDVSFDIKAKCYLTLEWPNDLGIVHGYDGLTIDCSNAPLSLLDGGMQDGPVPGLDVTPPVQVRTGLLQAIRTWRSTTYEMQYIGKLAGIDVGGATITNAHAYILSGSRPVLPSFIRHYLCGDDTPYAIEALTPAIVAMDGNDPPNIWSVPGTSGPTQYTGQDPGAVAYPDPVGRLMTAIHPCQLRLPCQYEQLKTHGVIPDAHCYANTNTIQQQNGVELLTPGSAPYGDVNRFGQYNYNLLPAPPTTVRLGGSFQYYSLHQQAILILNGGDASVLGDCGLMCLNLSSYLMQYSYLDTKELPCDFPWTEKVAYAPFVTAVQKVDQLAVFGNCGMVDLSSGTPTWNLDQPTPFPIATVVMP